MDKEVKKRMDEATGRHAEMPCPNCKKRHGLGAFATFPPDKDGDKFSTYPDVQCDRCGAVLRQAVPLIACGPPWYWIIIVPAIFNYHGPEQVEVRYIDADGNPAIKMM